MTGQKDLERGMKMSNRLGASCLAVALLLPGVVLAAPATYDSPDAAAEAVVTALRAADRQALLAVFGPENEDVIFTGEDPKDREIWTRYLASWDELHRVAEEADGTATIYIGADQWPVPAPLVKSADGKWSFDADAAREEVLNRRIGENELDVIALLRGYARVQSEYRQTDWDGDGILSFALDILSSEGKRDGLYWPSVEGTPESPVGDFMARAAAQGYSHAGKDVEPEPYMGYYYRVLGAQGPAAPGGAFDYVINGRMMAGHALIAMPADYGDTGIMSFMVGESGVVYEADLGEDTLAKASAISAFDPGDGWSVVEDD